jgi:hypothetical protein
MHRPSTLYGILTGDTRYEFMSDRKLDATLALNAALECAATFDLRQRPEWHAAAVAEVARLRAILSRLLSGDEPSNDEIRANPTDDQKTR